MGKQRRRLLLSIAGIVFVLLAAAAIWLLIPSQATAEGRAALQSDARVQVQTAKWLVFSPVGQTPVTGLIFYPGGKVDPVAYAPQAREVAAAGYLVVIVPMPLNLAVFDADRAAEVVSAYPQVHRWAIGGHSLGGAMAARFAHGHPGTVQGLVLWAAYPDGADNLAGSDLAVVSISGTRDGLATPAKIEASRALLPGGTRYVPIEGGNHAGFGWYGPQSGDNEATIGHELQQAQTVAATVDVLRVIEERGK